MKIVVARYGGLWYVLFDKQGVQELCLFWGRYDLKLIAIGLAEFSHLPPVEWRFKKSYVNGIINKENDQYSYTLYHPSFNEIKGEKVYSSLEDCRLAAEQFINTWYIVQGRILALK